MAKISLTAQAAGKRIREYREEKKWTINKMAAFAGMDAKHLKKLEDGVSEGTFLVYIHLMECMEKNISELFDQRFMDILYSLETGEMLS